MGNIWFASDHHFCHANILKFTNEQTNRLIRPDFKDVEEMNETMIQNHNKVVGQYDKVYFLGDVCFGRAENLAKIMPRLMGKFRLVLGNHDAQSYDITEYAKYFEKIMLWRPFKSKEIKYPFIATHVPMHPSSMWMRGAVWNVHGHIHEKDVYHELSGLDWSHGCVPTIDDRYLNICVEKINYTPIHMDEIQEKLSKTHSAWLVQHLPDKPKD